MSMPTAIQPTNRAARRAALRKPKPAAPSHHVTETDRLIAIYRSGNHTLTERRAHAYVQEHPNDPLGWKIYAAALAAQERWHEAVAVYRECAVLLDGDAEYHNNFATALGPAGDLAGADTQFQRAIALRPDYVEAYANLALILHKRGQVEPALGCLARAIRLRPDFAALYNNMGFILGAEGRLQEAALFYRKALDIDPKFLDALNNYATLLQKLVMNDPAEEIYRRILEIGPNYAPAHANIGHLLKSKGNQADSEYHLRRALELDPNHADAANTLGVLMQEQCKLDEAEALMRHAIAISPKHANANSNLLFFLAHKEGIDAPTLFEAHRAFAERFEAPLRASWPQHNNDRNPDRPIRVGFLSGDLREHPLMRYLLPTLTHLARRDDLILHAYSSCEVKDNTTETYKGLFHHWHHVPHLPDAQLAPQVHADAIDILIDLSGHTGFNRQLTLARKPAPIQVSWIGYVSTTGLDAVDYFITDPVLTPRGRFDNSFSEKLVYLPATTTFAPCWDSPDVQPLPALTNGYITFGSFNRIAKFNRSLIRCWAKVLHAVPNSRLFMASMPSEKPEPVVTWFAEEGIDIARLTFVPSMKTVAEILPLHHHVDICLDTFPHNGSTVSNHALWMGVPTLTMQGNTLAGRMGTALATNVGLDHMIATTEDEFIANARYWATHIDELAALRAAVRDRYAASIYLQHDVIADALAVALRTIWQRWCAGLQPMSF